jgi:hypothetical protein
MGVPTYGARLSDPVAAYQTRHMSDADNYIQRIAKQRSMTECKFLCAREHQGALRNTVRAKPFIRTPCA